MQTTGPHSRLGHANHFYNWLRESGLVPLNPIELVLARHSRARTRRRGKNKTLPLVDDVRTFLAAVRVTGSLRDVALVLAMLKWGARPKHVTLVHAEDLRGITDEGPCYADFEGVRERVIRENNHTRTKLEGELIRPIDEEFRRFLVTEYLPWRQEKWGYAWNEGPLFPSRMSPSEPYDDRSMQQYLMAPALTWLASNGTPAEIARWTRRAQTGDSDHWTPGCFRHFFTQTLETEGVQERDIAVLRGDIVHTSAERYKHRTPAQICDKYRFPDLLRCGEQSH